MALDRIRLLLLDVDGVLTDGSVLIDDLGRETKRFHARDGVGIRAAQRCGLMVGVLSGRMSRATVLRAGELGFDIVEQGASDKRVALERVCARMDVILGEIAYMGDDLPDLPVLASVGYPMTVADAPAEVREVAEWTSEARGGRGAVREAIEHLLRGTDRWDAAVESFWP